MSAKQTDQVDQPSDRADKGVRNRLRAFAGVLITVVGAPGIAQGVAVWRLEWLPVVYNSDYTLPVCWVLTLVGSHLLMYPLYRNLESIIARCRAVTRATSRRTLDLSRRQVEAVFGVRVQYDRVLGHPRYPATAALVVTHGHERLGPLESVRLRPGQSHRIFVEQVQSGVGPYSTASINGEVTIRLLFPQGFLLHIAPVAVTVYGDEESVVRERSLNAIGSHPAAIGQTRAYQYVTLKDTFPAEAFVRITLHRFSSTV